MGSGFQKLLTVFCVLICLATLTSPVSAQQKYNPDDPVIEKMARAAVGYLTARDPNNREDLLISALATLEVGKRYDRAIPRDHPLVARALKDILDGIHSDPGKNFQHYFKSNGVYPISVALILLCDIDDQKYAEEIKGLLNALQERQTEPGGFAYLASKDGLDVSQTQYAALALFVAKHHGFRINPNVGKKMLEWLIHVQTQEGSWYYQYANGSRSPHRKHPAKNSLSMHSSGLGTAYLLGDLLQLNPRAKNMSNLKGRSSNLPPSVSLYVKPKTDGAQVNKKGPLVKFDGGRLAGTKNRGNSYLEDNFDVVSPGWDYYYLYALERYAYFREQSEGSVRGVPDWYDQGVEHLILRQNADGDFARSQASHANPVIGTSLATLFLVRSSEVLVMPPNRGVASGNEGFEEDTKIVLSNGKIKTNKMVEGMSDVMTLLNDDETSDNALEEIAEAMDEAIGLFFKDESRSMAEKMAFMRALVKDKNYYRRLIACKFLAREQNMDNVPALLYALGDPDLRICREAHNGLRLISRRIDAFPITARADRSDFDVLKKKWTAWFLKIRPGAELFD